MKEHGVEQLVGEDGLEVKAEALELCSPSAKLRVWQRRADGQSGLAERRGLEIDG